MPSARRRHRQRPHHRRNSLHAMPFEVNFWQAQNIWNDLLRRSDKNYWSEEWKEELQKTRPSHEHLRRSTRHRRRRQRLLARFQSSYTQVKISPTIVILRRRRRTCFCTCVYAPSSLLIDQPRHPQAATWKKASQQRRSPTSYLACLPSRSATPLHRVSLRDEESCD